MTTLGAPDVRWHLADDAAELLCGQYMPVDEWLASGQARYVKRAPHRSVLHVRADGFDFHLKHYIAHGLRGWLRECLRPVKARREHDIARHLLDRGVNTHEPLGWGVAGGAWWPGDSYLLTRTLAGAGPLNEYLERDLPALPQRLQARQRQRLAKATAAFLAHMHAVGVIHHDPHPGNFLVRWRGGEPELYLIDLHAVELRSRVTFAQAFENLAVCNRYFAVRASRADRLRAWSTYRIAAGPPNLRMLPKLLEEATDSANRRLWRTRDGRSLRSNRYYQPVEMGAQRGHTLRSLPPAVWQPIMADPVGWMADPARRIVKSSPRSVVAFHRDPATGQGWVLKRFRIKAAREPWLSLVRQSPALRSWLFGHAFAERMLPTPRPALVFHTYRNGLPHDGYLLVPLVEGVQELQAWVRSLASVPTAERRTALLARIDVVARLVRHLHERGLSHRDLKAANLLTAAGTASTETQFIDLAGVSRPRRLKRRTRVQNLARLNASFLAEPLVNAPAKLRMLRTYLNANLSGAGSWKRWWRLIADATAAKVRQNHVRHRPLA